MARRYHDLTGKRFNRLLVLSFADIRNNAARWNVRCDCGTDKVVMGMNLVNGHVQSCGCLTKDMLTTHGMTKTRVFRTWSSMRNRCQNTQNRAFPNYGGRGITVCERWNTFEDFLADMGEPMKGMSLERIDNNKGYSPDNCRWANASDQNNNRRTCVLLEFAGKTQTIAQWSKDTGVPYFVLHGRIRRGWDTERAITTA